MSRPAAVPIIPFMLRFVLSIGLCLVTGAALAESPIPADAKVAFLGLTFLDTSQEGETFGENPEERALVEMAERMVTERFEAEGLTFVDTAPVQDRLDATVNPAKCYGCDTRMGATLGADYVLLGEIQKVSNLILAMNVQLRAVPSGDLVAGRSVEIRSNTDDSWARGIRYILENSIFREETQ